MQTVIRRQPDTRMNTLQEQENLYIIGLEEIALLSGQTLVSVPDPPACEGLVPRLAREGLVLTNVSIAFIRGKMKIFIVHV